MCTQATHSAPTAWPTAWPTAGYRPTSAGDTQLARGERGHPTRHAPECLLGRPHEPCTLPPARTSLHCLRCTAGAYELRRGNITPQPVFAARTTALRAALEQAGGGGKYGDIDMAVRSLIQQHHLLADVGGGGAGAGAGELLGGIGAARIYLPPMNPNGGGPVGGPQGRPQGDPMGGPQQQMQGLPQGGSQDDVLKMLAEAQARAAKVSVAADGTVGRV